MVKRERILYLKTTHAHVLSMPCAVPFYRMVILYEYRMNAHRVPLKGKPFTCMN